MRPSDVIREMTGFYICLKQVFRMSILVSKFFVTPLKNREWYHGNPDTREITPNNRSLKVTNVHYLYLQWPFTSMLRRL